MEQTIREVIKAMMITTKAAEISVIHISCSLSERDRSNSESSLGVAGVGVLPIKTVCMDDGGSTVGISITHVHGRKFSHLPPLHVVCQHVLFSLYSQFGSKIWLWHSPWYFWKPKYRGQWKAKWNGTGYYCKMLEEKPCYFSFYKISM